MSQVGFWFDFLLQMHHNVKSELVGSTVPVSTERINIFFTRRYFVVKKRIWRNLRSTCVRHHRRRENSSACWRSTTSNCCAQLFQNSSLSFLSVYAPAICSSSTNSRSDFFSPSILYSSRNLFNLGNVNWYHPLWDSKGSSDPRGEEVYLVCWRNGDFCLPFII